MALDRCPQGDCREVEGVKKTLYGSDGTGGIVGCTKKLDRRKVSWAQLGGIVILATTILGGSYLQTDYSRAKDIQRVEKSCDTNAKNVQEFSVNQAVIQDKLQKVEEGMQNLMEKREKDKEDTHKQIENVRKDIIDTIKNYHRRTHSRDSD